MATHHRSESDTEINITPMLDIVFIMLIFFIVTTSFVRERGLDISRPANTPEVKTEADLPIVVRIHNDNSLWLGDRQIERAALVANLMRENAVRPEAVLIVAAHVDALTDQLVAVVDAAKVAGIETISVAAQQ